MCGQLGVVTLSSLREVEIEIISILAENLHCNHEEVVMMMTPVRNITSCHRASAAEFYILF